MQGAGHGVASDEEQGRGAPPRDDATESRRHQGEGEGARHREGLGVVRPDHHRRDDDQRHHE